MPRVTQRVAAKDYPGTGIAKGDTYFYWKIKLQRGGRVGRSKTYPKRSQLTSSEYFGTAYDLDDQITDVTCVDDLRNIVSEISALSEEQQEKLDNMPEGLQQGATGELLSERVAESEEWASNVEAAADELENTLAEIDEAEAAEAAEPSDHNREFEQERTDALQAAVSDSGCPF